MIRINTTTFGKLQGDMSETDMARKINISRTQLWRAKIGGNVGENFISNVMQAFPKEKFTDLFITDNGKRRTG